MNRKECLPLQKFEFRHLYNNIFQSIVDTYKFSPTVYWTRKSKNLVSIKIAIIIKMNKMLPKGRKGETEGVRDQSDAKVKLLYKQCFGKYLNSQSKQAPKKQTNGTKMMSWDLIRDEKSQAGRRINKGSRTSCFENSSGIANRVT